jgi:hypothetical protein
MLKLLCAAVVSLMLALDPSAASAREGKSQTVKKVSKAKAQKAGAGRQRVKLVQRGAAVKKGKRQVIYTSVRRRPEPDA